MQQHPEIKSRLATWTKAVFLMLHAQAGGDKGGLLAVSTSQPLSGPPADVRLGAAAARRWQALRDTPLPGTRVRHYDGGPLDRGSPIAVAYVPASAAEPARLRSLTAGGVQRALPAWVYGGYDAVAAVVQEAQAASAAAPLTLTTINVVWGYGGWGARKCSQKSVEEGGASSLCPHTLRCIQILASN